MKNKNRITRLGMIVLVITLLIVSWVIFEVFIRGTGVVKTQYGVDPSTFVFVLLGAEVFFDLGIILIILGSGALKLRLRHIIKFDFSNIVFENELVYTGFTINRIAALIPPLYLLVVGWNKLPLYIELLLFLELAIVIAIGSIPFEFGKYLWRKNEKY